MTSKMGAYAYSLNEEDFEQGGDSRETALEAALFAVSDRTGDDEHADYKPGQWVTVWTGRSVKQAPDGYAMGCADAVLDRARDAAYDEAGEHSEGWLELTTPEQDAGLDAMVAAAFGAWCKKHGLEPKFYSVVDVQKHEIVAGESDTP